MKIHLVDGTFELFRAYYGGLSRGDGNAVRGLVRSMLALLGEPGVTHVGIAFDHVVESFRNALYPGYKTGEGIDPDLFAQFGPAEDACRALGLVVWSMVEFEADDALAAAAHRLANQPSVEQIVICSPDKDLAQCVRGNRVVRFDRIRRKTLDAVGVEAKFGVPPESIPDWLALVGDAADGFPGIPRWGAKSAAAVLAEYGKLERIPDDSREWTVQVRGASALAANLRAQRSQVELYRQLATLRIDVPLTETVDDLRWRGADERAFAALGFADLAERARSLADSRRGRSGGV